MPFSAAFAWAWLNARRAGLGAGPPLGIAGLPLLKAGVIATVLRHSGALIAKDGAHRKRVRLQGIPALLMAHDIEALGGVQKLFRELVHSLYGIRGTGRNKQYDKKLIRTYTRLTALENDGAEAFTHTAERPEKPGAGQWKLTAKLLVKMPAVRRRIELDVNGPERNLCHVQALHLRKKAGFYLVTFSEQLTLSEADFPVSIVSLPSKFIGYYFSGRTIFRKQFS